MLTPSVINYTVVAFQYDPVADTDFVNTRQEITCTNLAKAQEEQQKLVESLRLSEIPYRCYIQERECYSIQTGKRTWVNKYRVKRIHDYIELNPLENQ